MSGVFLVLASFLASAVEVVEAVTIVLAAGLTRGWRSSLIGSGVALVVLGAITAILGPALTLIPLDALQLVVGGAPSVQPCAGSQSLERTDPAAAMQSQADWIHHTGDAPQFCTHGWRPSRVSHLRVWYDDGVLHRCRGAPLPARCRSSFDTVVPRALRCYPWAGCCRLFTQ